MTQGRGQRTGGRRSFHKSFRIAIADASPESTGKGGDITIQTNQLILNKGQISATTFGNADAGNLTINATELIELTGELEFSRSGLLANALVGSGTGGNINVSTGELIISDGATITASNFSSRGFSEPGTGEPGNINIQANSILLENGGRIEAATQSEIGDNANITLDVAEDIILKNNSFISARALEKADGGNLDIDARFIIAFPNQDNNIIASAEQGNGGKIDINVESLFGIKERPLNDLTNDLNADSASGIDGEISINTPDTDPIRGLDNLPNNVIDASNQMVRTCLTAEEEKSNKFVLTGRGGIPNNPTESVQGDATISAEWLTLPETTGELSEAATKIENNPPAEIVEAKGWIINEQGNVVLTATANNTPVTIPWLVPHSCQDF